MGRVQEYAFYVISDFQKKTRLAPTTRVSKYDTLPVLPGLGVAYGFFLRSIYLLIFECSLGVWSEWVWSRKVFFNFGRIATFTLMIAELFRIDST